MSLLSEACGNSGSAAMAEWAQDLHTGTWHSSQRSRFALQSELFATTVFRAAENSHRPLAEGYDDPPIIELFHVPTQVVIA